jgi:hypothetical protein
MKKIQLIHAGTFYQGTITSVEHGKLYYSMSICMEDGQLMDVVGKGKIEEGRVNDRTFIVRIWDAPTNQLVEKLLNYIQ